MGRYTNPVCFISSKNMYSVGRAVLYRDFVTILWGASMQYITKLATSQSQKPIRSREERVGIKLNKLPKVRNPVPPPPKYNVMYPLDARLWTVKNSSCTQNNDARPISEFTLHYITRNLFTKTLYWYNHFTYFHFSFYDNKTYPLHSKTTTINTLSSASFFFSVRSLSPFRHMKKDITAVLCLTHLRYTKYNLR